MTAEQDRANMMGEFQSPGGFVFGVQGFTWGEPRPTAITFFLDGSAKVSDQHGRPIRGALVDGKKIMFADSAPENDQSGKITPRPQFATHAQVIAALSSERVDWKTLACAGWPQLPYAELVKLNGQLPPTPPEELAKIRDLQLRKDALKVRRGVIEAEEREIGVGEEDS